MWILLIPLLAQVPLERSVIEAEQAREAGVPRLLAAVTSPDVRAQRLGARGLGRLERPEYASALVPLLRSTDASVRRAAVSALAQMRAPFAYGDLLAAERDASVRAVIYEAIGRAKPPGADAEALLASGLAEAGAGARGMESLFRLNPQMRPAAAWTLRALHAAFAANPSEETRELILLTMRAVGDRDADTLTMALADASPQVRRLAVGGSRSWMDPSPIVRLEALRVAKSCELAAEAMRDSSEHVALFAVDQFGSLKCHGAHLDGAGSWRFRAHALVALAEVAPERAREMLPGMMKDPNWVVRVYAARAARALGDSAALTKLARDANPNVAIAALTTPEDAMRGIRSNHSGLVLAGAERLKGVPDLKDRVPELVEAFQRLTRDGRMTVRDPRVALLARIGEVNDSSTAGLLKAALRDRDPAVAALAGKILGTEPVTRRLPIPPLPPAAYIRGLEGAMARITMRGLGTMTVDLLTEEAPVTVGVFAQLAEAGKYNGLTFHRVVPNFVIQGGSPGADEYDALSRDFLRDEPGFARNTRGTIGISTRGRDTGDAQIYFNLVDNSRLDREYTVMARMRDGLEVMDRVQEGDVIERVQIIRRGK